MRLFWIFALILLGAFLFNASSPLQGIHTIRQSDTVFAAYSYCMEGTDFLKPKVAHRGTTSGVAIGEFPLYSYIVSLPCQVRGSWSEYDPKFFILFFWILNFLIWTAWAKLYLKLAPSNKDDIASLAIIFGFSTFALLYLTISLPDNLAFLLIGLAAYLQISDFRLLNRTLSQKSISILSALLFILGFAVRPYLIPLILLVHRRWWWLTLTTVGCGIVYLLWYKIWAQQSDINYYYLAIPPLSEVVSGLPQYGWPLLGNILRQMFQYVFIILIIWKWRKLNPWEVFGFFGTVFLLILVRGEHLVIHGYYLWAAAIFAGLCLLRALQDLPRKWQTAALVIYVLIGFAQTQHEFHAQRKEIYQKLKNLLIEENVAPDAKIAVYVGDGSCATQYLYWMKHQGWCFYNQEFKGPEFCPKGADYYFKFNEQDEPILRSCVFAPTEKSPGK